MVLSSHPNEFSTPAVAPALQRSEFFLSRLLWCQWLHQDAGPAKTKVRQRAPTVSQTKRCPNSDLKWVVERYSERVIGHSLIISMNSVSLIRYDLITTNINQPNVCWRYQKANSRGIATWLTVALWPVSPCGFPQEDGCGSGMTKRLTRVPDPVRLWTAWLVQMYHSRNHSK